MKVDTIITLDNNKKYGLLEETEIDGAKYFLAIGLDKNDNPIKEYEIFQEIRESGDIYMEIVDNDNDKKALLSEFTDNFVKEIDEYLGNNG